jgi:hypothetical protein
MQWMDGDPQQSAKASQAAPIDTLLDQVQKIDLTRIEDERARAVIGFLLNLVEELRGELKKAQQENAYLRKRLRIRPRWKRKAGGSGREFAATADAFLRERAEGTPAANQAGKVEPDPDRQRSAAESGSCDSSAGCGSQGLRSGGGARVADHHRQCTVSEAEILLGVARQDLFGAAARRLPGPIRTQCENVVRDVLVSVPHDRAQDRRMV